MFTGIVEQTVAITGVKEIGSSRRIILPASWSGLALGQSIAVNGCCLTVAALSADHVEFDVVAETLARTNLGALSTGDLVHLERSLRVGDRLDGHMVQGHIDGVARLISRQDDASECRLILQTPPDLAAYIVPKGSVTLDGVSLTVAAVRTDSFEVALIPTTLRVTALGQRKIGYEFNLETDILAKTIVFWLERRENVRETGGG